MINILKILFLSSIPYLFYSTYFFICAWQSNGKGPEAGYKVLAMLPTMESVYWGSIKFLIVSWGLLFCYYLFGKIKNVATRS